MQQPLGHDIINYADQQISDFKFHLRHPKSLSILVLSQHIKTSMKLVLNT